MTAATTKAFAKPAKILLVSQNKEGRTARKQILEEEGFSVAAAASADEALEIFDQDTFDVVVANYSLGKTNGAELIVKLRAKRAEIPVVLLSGLVEVLGLTEKNTGANCVIQKSANEVTQLVRAVRRLTTPKKPQGKSGGRPPRRKTGAD